MAAHTAAALAVSPEARAAVLISQVRAACYLLAVEDVDRAFAEALRVDGRKQLVTLPEVESQFTRGTPL